MIGRQLFWTICSVILATIDLGWSQPPYSNYSQRYQAPCSTSPAFYGLPSCSLDVNDTYIVRHHSRVRNPKDLHDQALPTLADHIRLLDYHPDFSIIVSAHNQGNLIHRNLHAILSHTQGIWQLIVVFDGCEDHTLTESRTAVRTHIANYSSIFSHMVPVPNHGKHGQARWECQVRQALRRGTLSDLRDNTSFTSTVDPGFQADSQFQPALHSLLTDVTFIEQSSSVYEASSDNIGMTFASPSKYFILVQADMWITSPGWNFILARPAELFADIISVSARCAHSFLDSEDFKVKGRCGPAINQLSSPEELKEFEKHVYISGTVNRGPLLLRSDRVIALGLLDEENFVLGSDDHDLMARALLKFNWKSAGYFAVDFQSHTSEGSTRTHTETAFAERDAAFMHDREKRMNVVAGKARQKAASLATIEEIRDISPLDIQHVTAFFNQRLAFTLCCASESRYNHSDGQLLPYI